MGAKNTHIHYIMVMVVVIVGVDPIFYWQRTIERFIADVATVTIFGNVY